MYPIDITAIRPTHTVPASDTKVINIPEPVPPLFTVRDAFDLDPFYQQWIDVEGLPVVASANVNPYALKEAVWQIWQMIGHRPDVLQALVQNRAYFTVIGYTELPSQIPDYSDQGPDFLTYRARAFGGGGLSGHPAVRFCGGKPASLSRRRWFIHRSNSRVCTCNTSIRNEYN